MPYSELLQNLPSKIIAPTSVALLTSFGLHSLVLGVGLPNLAIFASPDKKDKLGSVPVIELTPIEQSRLPDLSANKADIPSFPNSSLSTNSVLGGIPIGKIPNTKTSNTITPNNNNSTTITNNISPPPPPTQTGGTITTYYPDLSNLNSLSTKTTTILPGVPQTKSPISINKPKIPTGNFNSTDRIPTPKNLGEIATSLATGEILPPPDLPSNNSNIDDSTDRKPIKGIANNSETIEANTNQTEVPNQPSNNSNNNNNNNNSSTQTQVAINNPETNNKNPEEQVQKTLRARQQRSLIALLEKAKRLKRDNTNTSDEEAMKNDIAWLNSTKNERGQAEKISIDGTYPKEAWWSDLKGTAIVGIVVDSQGKVIEPNNAEITKILKSSGYPVLNEQAIEDIKSETFPNNTGQNKFYRVAVNFDYADRYKTPKKNIQQSTKKKEPNPQNNTVFQPEEAAITNTNKPVEPSNNNSTTSKPPKTLVVPNSSETSITKPELENNSVETDNSKELDEVTETSTQSETNNEKITTTPIKPEEKEETIVLPQENNLVVPSEETNSEN
jgi:outer membrane biosynthesis protein TonB